MFSFTNPTSSNTGPQPPKLTKYWMTETNAQFAKRQYNATTKYAENKKAWNEKQKLGPQHPGLVKSILETANAFEKRQANAKTKFNENKRIANQKEANNKRIANEHQALIDFKAQTEAAQSNAVMARLKQEKNAYNQSVAHYDSRTFGINLSGPEPRQLQDITQLTNLDYILNILDLIHALLDQRISLPQPKNTPPVDPTKPNITTSVQENLKAKKFQTKYTDMESTLKLLIYGIAYSKGISLDITTLNLIYANLLDIRNFSIIANRINNIILFTNDHRQMKFLIALMGYIDAIMAKGESDWLGVQSGLKGDAKFSMSNVIDQSKLNYHNNPIEYLFGIHGGVLVRYLTTNNYTTGAKILKSKVNNFNNNKINSYLNIANPGTRTNINTVLKKLGSLRNITKTTNTFLSKYGLNKTGQIRMNKTTQNMEIELLKQQLQQQQQLIQKQQVLPKNIDKSFLV